MKTNSFLILMCFIFCVACGTNEFCLDIDKQRMVSDSYISKIVLHNLNTNEKFIITKTSKDYRSKIFYLNEFDTVNYSYSRKYLEYIKVDKPKLSPDTSYEVTNNSIGDAADFIINIKTDSKGAIIYSDCN